MIRDWQPGDLAVLHEINEASVPGVGTTTRAAHDRLVSQISAATLVAVKGDRPVGFVLCLLDGQDYASLNYKWVSARYDKFAYIDRVAVAPEMRGRKIGEALYAAAFGRFAGKREVLLAEVNLAPPNPGSLRFHKRLEFREVGERWDDANEKGVVYLERKL
jgi:predicted GNAT superfamily acetyltransferase